MITAIKNPSLEDLQHPSSSPDIAPSKDFGSFKVAHRRIHFYYSRKVQCVRCKIGHMTFGINFSAVDYGIGEPFREGYREIRWLC
jgi:hypothetical protein